VGKLQESPKTVENQSQCEDQHESGRWLYGCLFPIRGALDAEEPPIRITVH
jgi:hypothetical protein